MKGNLLSNSFCFGVLAIFEGVGEQVISIRALQLVFFWHEKGGACRGRARPVSLALS